MDTKTYDVGRGDTATTDMKARLDALRRAGTDWLDVLWERNLKAVHGDGHTYEYAGIPEPINP